MGYGDLTKYKVVYKDKCLRALALMNIVFAPDEWPSPEKPEVKPEYLTVLTINADGVLEALTGESKDFQFIPVLK